MSSLRSTLSKRARAVAGATAISLTGFAAAGFGGFRPASAYGAGSYSSRSGPMAFPVTCDYIASTDDSLQAAVASATNGERICISESITLSATLVLNDTSVTLAGRDDSAVTLTGPAAPGINRRHIYADFSGVGDDTLTIDRLTMSGGYSGFYAGPGGSILLRSDAGSDALALHDSHFDNNDAPLGGAIYAEGPVSISTGTFTGNSAQKGGGIFAKSSLSTNGVTFSGNRGPGVGGVGGAVYVRGAMLSSDDTFIDNYAQSSGGAIRGRADIVTSNSVFYANTAAQGHGGAIYTNGSVTSTNGHFTANYARSRGGAIFGADFVITSGTNFYDDTAQTSNGGAIASNSDVSVSYGNFGTNYARQAGGAIWTNRGASVSTHAVNFRGNWTDNWGGGAIYAYDSAAIAYSTFASNRSARLAGAVYTNGVAAVTNTTFMGNEAPASGSIKASSVALNFVTALDDSASGGAAIDATSITLRGSVISPLAGTASCANAADDSSLDGFTTDASCGYGDDTVTIATRLQLGLSGPLVTDDSTGAQVLIPDDTSVLINAAPANLVSGVTLDQLRAVRGRVPDDSTTVGAVQVLPIAFTTQPDDTTAVAGSTPTFTVAAVPGVGTGPLTYQWQAYDDTSSTWVNIAGATSATYSLASPATTDDSGLTLRALAADMRGVPVPSDAARLTLAVAPSAPQNPSARAGDASAVLSWDPPSTDGGAPITGYTVTSAPGGLTCVSSTPSCTVTGLTNGTTYTFTVTATSNAGTSIASGATAAVTPTAPPTPTPTPTPSPPTAPLDPSATAGNRQAVITWSAPSSSGSFPITTYEVQSETGGKTCLLTVGTDTPLACTVTGLIDGTTYRFRVRALNGATWGPWSDWTDPVTPEPTPVSRSILITGSRDGRAANIAGRTTGIGANRVTSHVKLQGQSTYRVGSEPGLNSAGRFSWQRKTNNKVYVYFTADGIRSNRVTIPAKK